MKKMTAETIQRSSTESLFEFYNENILSCFPDAESYNRYTNLGLKKIIVELQRRFENEQEHNTSATARRP